jgi:lipoate-protein ligase B
MAKPWWYWIEFEQLGYEPSLQLQRALVSVVAANEGVDGVVLLLEHPPVFTLGKRGGRDNLTVPERFLQKKGIPIIPIERGGDITYHGPGQLVGYPVVSLKRSGMKVVDYVHLLEEVMLRTAGAFGIKADRDNRNRGIWVGDAKLGSIGIHVRRGVSFHGFALNVCTDLDPFGWINPCGLSGVGVTSMAEQCGKTLSITDVRYRLKQHLGTVFQRELIPIEEKDLARMTGRQAVGP